MKGKKGALIALASIPLISWQFYAIAYFATDIKRVGYQCFSSQYDHHCLWAHSHIMIPIAGYFSDRFGRKIVILPSLILAALGGTVCVVSTWFLNVVTAYWVILRGRFLQGIGAAGAFPIVLPFVADLFKDEREVSKGLGVIEDFEYLR